MNTKITIPIKKSDDDEVVIIPPGKGGINSEIKNRLDKIDQVVYGVMVAVVLSSIAIIVSVVGLFLDQMRVNNEVYKEYIKSNQFSENTEKYSQSLLKQNQDNQEIIINLQKQILNKK